MMTPEEYVLKAENYAFAARVAPPELQPRLIRAAAICRNKALRLTLAARKGETGGAHRPSSFLRCN